MIPRVLEPELMDDPEESESYDAMGHDAVNRQFVDDLLGVGAFGPDILDVGTGTARIPVELCQRLEDARVMASDAATSMLEIAKINIAIGGFEHQIQLHFGDAKALGFEAAMFDCVVSNSLIHHLPTPMLAMQEMVRVLKPNGRIFVRDLFRPESDEAVEKLVQTYAAEESERNQQLLRQSLHAALRVDEVREMVKQLGFDPSTVNATSDRHWTWSATKNQ